MRETDIDIHLESGLYITATNRLAQIMTFDEKGIMMHITMKPNGHVKMMRGHELILDTQKIEEAWYVA